jgi:hypothetical protein
MHRSSSNPCRDGAEPGLLNCGGEPRPTGARAAPHDAPRLRGSYAMPWQGVASQWRTVGFRTAPSPAESRGAASPARVTAARGAWRERPEVAGGGMFGRATSTLRVVSTVHRLGASNACSSKPRLFMRVQLRVLVS